MSERLQVLLVEDSDSDEALLRRGLEKAGIQAQVFRVMEAESMRDALQSQAWDLILSDYRLPQFSAVAALRLMKEMDLDLPFIIVSGTVDEETAVEVMRAGAHDFLPKGSLARLGAAIEREVKESRARALRRKSDAQMMGMEKLAALGALAAGVAHEIANPIAYAHLNLEMLAEALKREPGKLPADAMEMIDRVMEGLEQVKLISSDLKSFAKTREGSSELVDLSAGMETALKMVAHEFRHRAQIIKEFKPVPPVKIQSGRISQIFMNLLINSAHAMPLGRADKNRVTLRIHSRDAGWVTAEIEDTGEGIPKENQRKILEPFFTTKPQGTGLGLPLVQKLVEEAGGKLQIESQVGWGTLVRIELPAAHGSAGARVKRDLEIPGFSRKGRILIVDDEPAMAEVVGRFLGRWHDIEFANNGLEALNKIESKDYDLVLSDLMMPEMTGAELYDRIKGLRPGAEKKMAFLTGGAFTEDTVRFLSEVSNQRLEKPFQLAELSRLVESSMGPKK